MLELMYTCKNWAVVNCSKNDVYHLFHKRLNETRVVPSTVYEEHFLRAYQNELAPVFEQFLSSLWSTLVPA